MEDGKSQKELFNFNDKPRKVFPDLMGFLPKADLEGKIAITMTLEKIVFITITVMLLMVVVFALGVERGKIIARPAISIAIPAQGSPSTQARPAAQKPQVAPPQPAAATQQAATLQSTAIKIKTVPIAKVAPMQQAAAADKTARPYTIVAATFANKGTAAQEMTRLKKDGFDAMLVQSGRYFRLCIGAYPDKESAQGSLKRVKQRYKDAYIKLK